MRTVLSKILQIVYMIVIILLVADVIFVDNTVEYFCQKSRVIPNVLIALGVVIITSCIFLILRGLKKRNVFPLNIKFKQWRIITSISKVKHIETIILICVSSVVFVFQLFITKRIYFNTGWDCGTLLNSANTVGNGHGPLKTMEYFSEYPNNIVLTSILSLFYQLVPTSPYRMILVANCFLVNLSGIFMLLSLKKLTLNKGLIGLGYGIYIVLVALSPWIVIPYSDTFAVVFPVLVLYLYLQTRDKKLLVLKWLFIGLFSFFGMAIKPTVIIMLMAVLINETIVLIGNKDRIKAYGKMILGIGIGYVCLMPLQTICIERLGLELDVNREITITHFAMLGLNKERDGVYNDQDMA